MSVITQNRTYRITNLYTNWNDTLNETEVADPDSVEVRIYTTSVEVANLVTTTVPIKVTDGEYYYDLNYSGTGKIIVVFEATFGGSNLQDTEYELEVIAEGGSSSGTVFKTLIEDQTLLFSSGMTPLYFNPEEILYLFPDSNELEVAEYIHYASLEVLDILCADASTTTYADLPYIAIEYIQASVACSLSRIYEDGFGVDASIRLGDMSVTNPNAGGTGRYINRANASTWCQLASALRKELLQESTKFGSNRGLKAFTKGSRYPNPIPDRTILHVGEARVDRYELRDNRALKSLED